MNELKYKIDGLRECPPKNCIEQTKEAYRFIKDVISEESFFPLGIQNPSRNLGNSDSNRCKAYVGLSLFDSENDAKELYKELCRRNRRPIRTLKSLGNKLAKGKLTPRHGLCSPSNSSGHFTLYEYVNSNIERAFSVIGEISC